MATLPWADVFTFNGEAQLLKYRLALHSRFVSSFVVVESNVSFMGRPKSHTLMADYLLSTEDRRRYNVDVLQTPFTERERGPGNPWVKEFATRKFVTRVIADRFPSHRVYHSDVDELLDPQAVAELDVTQCIAPRLRFYYYSEHCPVNETWAGSIITRTDSTWFHRHSQRSTMLRAHAGTALSHANHACNISDAYLGWHMSYALPNEAILVKMRSFSHAYFGSIKYVLNQRDPEAFINSKVRECGDLLGRSGAGAPRAEESAYDGHLPPLSGWPTHPAAPRDRSVVSSAQRGTQVKLLGQRLFRLPGHVPAG